MSAEIKPILARDLPAVSAFLHGIYPDRSAADWQTVLTPTWPDSGDMRDNCNLTSWYVDLDEGRGLGVKMLRAAVDDDSAVYATHSPEPRTIKVFLRLGFQFIDTTEWIVPNLPGLGRGGFIETQDIDAHLSGDALANYRTHADMPGIGHVGLTGPDNEFCHIAFVRSRWRRVPVARIVYANDYGLLQRCLPAFARIALTRLGFPLTAVEKRRHPARPRLATAERAKEPILYRGTGVEPDQIDITCSRPGGLPFDWQGHTIRPTQDCSTSYGAAIVLNRIDVLTPTEFKETTIARIDPDPRTRYRHGVHTLNVVDGMIIVDAKRHVRHPLAPVYRWLRVQHSKRRAIVPS